MQLSSFHYVLGIHAVPKLKILSTCLKTVNKLTLCTYFNLFSKGKELTYVR
jgi:hypothetical protein